MTETSETKEWADGCVRLSIDEGQWRVTLNRADKANALTVPMLEALVEIVRSASPARVFVLTGVGKVFSAGADLEAARAGLATSPLWEELSSGIVRLPGMTIAALNGTMAGGSMGMGLACDIRIAVPGARFFYPVMTLGYLPQPSDPGRLKALIGPSRTKMMLMSGAKIDAETALSFGLLDQIVAPEDMEATITALAAPVLQASPEIAYGIKSLCNR